MRLITLQVESMYHSFMGRTRDTLHLGVYLQPLAVDQRFDPFVHCRILGTHFNLRGDRDAEIHGDIVELTYRYESVRFLYDLKTGRATYLLACTDHDFEYYAKALEGRKMPAGRRPHPFSIHFILLFKSVLERDQALEDSLRSLLLLEDRSIFRKSKVTFEAADDTKRRLQDLHSLFKEALISDNNNKRQIATIDCLIRDLDRLAKTVKENPWACPIDEHDHQRIIDGFRCLKDFCQDRERRLKSRSQRVQNLIALVRLAPISSSFM